MQFLNINTGYASGSGILRTTNGGTNWAYISPSSNNYSKLIFIDSLYAYNISGANVNRTTNGGLSWTALTLTPQVGARSLSFLNRNLGIIHGSWYNKVGNYGKSVFTTNGGMNWSAPVYGVQGGPFIAGGFLDSNFFYTAGGNRVALTTNGGLNWAAIDVPNAGQIQSIQFVNQSTGYLCHLNGPGGFVSVTTNSGANWFASPILPAVPLYSICFTSPTIGYVSGSSGAIFKTTTGGVVTGFTQNGSHIPDNFSLSQNYPNPFNPQTRINYELPITNFVSIKVYDALGNEVETIVNEKQNAGSYSVDFNAASLPSGIYFYKLVTEKFSETKKMILVK